MASSARSGAQAGSVSAESEMMYASACLGVCMHASCTHASPEGATEIRNALPSEVLAELAPFSLDDAAQTHQPHAHRGRRLLETQRNLFRAFAEQIALREQIPGFETEP
jgi:hypothetical protein